MKYMLRYKNIPVTKYIVSQLNLHKIVFTIQPEMFEDMFCITVYSSGDIEDTLIDIVLKSYEIERLELDLNAPSHVDTNHLVTPSLITEADKDKYLQRLMDKNELSIPKTVQYKGQTITIEEFIYRMLLLFNKEEESE